MSAPLAPFPAPLDLAGWITANRHLLKPPVGNKLLYGDGQQKLMIVAGPNVREDFHIEEGEELFYMLEGDMVLEVVEKGQRRSIPIRQGEMFLLPPRIPHSPQRAADTIGLVWERERLPTEMDCLRWHVGPSTSVLYQEWFHCDDLGTQLPPVMKRFFASPDYAAGHPVTPIPPDAFAINSEITLSPPFSLAAAMTECGVVAGGGDAEYTVAALVGEGAWPGVRVEEGEVVIWCLAGSMTLTHSLSEAEEGTAVPAGSVILLPKATPFTAKWSGDARALVITNKVVL